MLGFALPLCAMLLNLILIFLMKVVEFLILRCLKAFLTLTILRVSSNIISYYPPTSGCFPSLQFLHISADNPCKESIEKLFSCCPVVEYLSIHLSVGPGFIHKINISVPQLKTLQISLDEDNENKNYFYINAPQLDNLNLKGRDLSNYFLENAISGINASFAFKYLSRVKYLSLSAYSLDARYLPVLVNLTKLKLVLHECKYWELLAELLLRAPNLEDLALEDKTARNGKLSKERAQTAQQGTCTDSTARNVQGYSTASTARNVQVHVCCQITKCMCAVRLQETYSEEEYSEVRESPKFLPNCLSSHLKTISVTGFKGRPIEREAAKYMLRNGHLLNKMTIYIHRRLFCKKEELLKEFLMFHRAMTCQVEFIEMKV